MSTLFMKRFLLSVAFALVAGVGSASEKPFLMTHQESDPRFLVSIERVGACQDGI
jgi:hypothetical protein